MYLGEVMAETFEKNFRVIKDEEANRYVRAVGEKLIKHLPATNIKFQFFIVDVPDVNAFAVAGGRIYVTRKLISFVRSEDELAGIIGHELGHGIVRHHSADMSKLFKEILGVQEVGSREDVFEKFNQFIDKQNTKRVRMKKSHEGDQQLEADKVGLFAMIAAGYDPRAFTSAWERLTETQGKTGNAVTEFFGTTRPEEKRLREMLKAISALPGECLDKKAIASNDEFKRWQSYVVTTSSFQKEEKLKSLLAKKSLNPFLRGDVSHLQFSPDGNYILAQDASGINVLKREPFGFVFRIDADNAKPANFAPDSKHFSFQTYGLK
jgi:predicted Zn-dependent protease